MLKVKLIGKPIINIMKMIGKEDGDYVSDVGVCVLMVDYAPKLDIPYTGHIVLTVAKGIGDKISSFTWNTMGFNNDCKLIDSTTEKADGYFTAAFRKAIDEWIFANGMRIVFGINGHRNTHNMMTVTYEDKTLFFNRYLGTQIYFIGNDKPQSLRYKGSTFTRETWDEYNEIIDNCVFDEVGNGLDCRDILVELLKNISAGDGSIGEIYNRDDLIHPRNNISSTVETFVPMNEDLEIVTIWSIDHTKKLVLNRRTGKHHFNDVSLGVYPPTTFQYKGGSTDETYKEYSDMISLCIFKGTDQLKRCEVDAVLKRLLENITAGSIDNVKDSIHNISLAEVYGSAGEILKTDIIKPPKLSDSDVPFDERYITVNINSADDGVPVVGIKKALRYDRVNGTLYLYEQALSTGNILEPWICCFKYKDGSKSAHEKLQDMTIDFKLNAKPIIEKDVVSSILLDVLKNITIPEDRERYHNGYMSNAKV